MACPKSPSKRMWFRQSRILVGNYLLSHSWGLLNLKKKQYIPSRSRITQPMKKWKRSQIWFNAPVRLTGTLYNIDLWKPLDYSIINRYAFLVFREKRKTKHTSLIPNSSSLYVTRKLIFKPTWNPRKGSGLRVKFGCAHRNYLYGWHLRTTWRQMHKALWWKYGKFPRDAKVTRQVPTTQQAIVWLLGFKRVGKPVTVTLCNLDLYMIPVLESRLYVEILHKWAHAQNSGLHFLYLIVIWQW